MLETATTAELRRLAFLVAPELAASPLYILGADRVADMPFEPGWLGLALCSQSDIPDYNLRAAIGDDWQGRGNIFLLDDAAIRAEAEIESEFLPALRGVLLHEVAHLLPAKYIHPRDWAEVFDCAAVRERQREQLAEAEAAPRPPAGTVASRHDARFLRRCVHLWVRARAAGWDVSLTTVLCGDLWFAEPLLGWLPSLLPELFTLQRESFTTIEATAPPAAFSARWNQSIEVFNVNCEAKI